MLSCVCTGNGNEIVAIATTSPFALKFQFHYASISVVLHQFRFYVTNCDNLAIIKWGQIAASRALDSVPASSVCIRVCVCLFDCLFVYNLLKDLNANRESIDAYT